ncbi:hypothetical protein [Actinacidiphila acididurans]|uniref:Uncharacterized protein n=1 Tax=Actinacidiphila acididurans TaxID=2784346 RepID=A0ABS2TWE3_9ACTN|nr:hypothetical protein [Actinacidiphila acididurans]MBM9507662.1 hypothetical protein [Actinacidiphila acididurans]
MISLTTVKMSDRSVIAASPLGMSLRGTGLSAASLLVMPSRERSIRPTQAPAVAAAAKAIPAYGFAAAANGAGAAEFALTGAAPGSGLANGQQKTTQHGKWAFRGLEPWSDPA